MKNTIKGLLLIMIIMGVSLLMPGFMENTTKAADEAEWSDDGTTQYDGFTILEIMPYKGMGELGYLIDGQEPVDDELFSYNSGPGSFSHVDGALKFFPSYTQKDIPANGQIDSGWQPAFTEVQKNGYFESGYSGADLYTVSENQKIYQRVADGTGTHRAYLPPNAKLEKVYQQGYEPYMRQNVIAYFTAVLPEDESLLFSKTVRYKAYCAKASDNKIGDYDYDAEQDTFILDPGNGSYDVIFEQDDNGKYYMLDNYEIVEDNSGEYSYTDIKYDNIGSGGNYIENTQGMTFTYQRWSGGSYRFVEDNTALSRVNFSKQTVNGRTRIWVQGQKVVKRYQHTYRLGIVNNEWFKRFSLGVPSKLANDYPVRVITLTPDELNANLHHEQDLINEAGLIYINAYEHDELYIRLYEQYSYEGLALPSNMKYNDDRNKKNTELNFARHDINWTVTDKLFRKIAGIGCNKAAAIVDCSFYFQAVNGEGQYSTYYRNNSALGVNYSDWDQDVGATSINMAKLYIMIYQRNKIDFYNSFMNPATTQAANRITARTVATNVSPTGSTASFVRPQASYAWNHNFSLYWNGNTFLPWGLNASGQMVQIPEANFKAMGIYNQDMNREKNNLTDNVLTLYGDVGRILGSRFIEDVRIPDQDGDGQPDEIPRDDLGEIITGGGSGYGDTGGVSYPPGGVVEGPPDSPVEVPDDPEVIPEDGSSGSNVRSYKRVLNIQPTAYFTLSETAIRNLLSGYDVQIINMTSTQFNGSLEDINSNYDMVFMGSAINAGISYNRFNVNSNKTDFKDNSLDSYFYIDNGDQMMLTIAGSPVVRYRNNDITAQKKFELTEFLKAGYPIVLDSYLYGLNSTDGRVKNSTNMYSFVNSNKGISSYKLLNYADAGQSSFKSKLKDGLEITKPRITLISPISPEGAPIETAELVIEFQLYPWSDMRKYYKYNAYFYVDKDANGIFEATDKINTSSRDGSNWENILLSENTRSYKYKVPSLNGVYQWKLLVERSDNPRIRASITGYVSNTNKETLNILHIRDNSSTYDLKTNIENISSSLIYNLAGDGKLDQYSLKFDSMTVDQYEKLFTSPNVPYNSASPETTGKLSKYHLLILDNPTDPIDNTNGTETDIGAATNIKDEIGRNLGVIYTKNALGYERQKTYYSQNSYSFLNHDTTPTNYTYTYNYINRNAVTSGYMMIYRNMIGENSSNLWTDAAYRTNYLTKTNEGSITRYPYQIGKAISIADNSYSNDAVIDYDLTLTPKQKLVGWYCLSDTKSPVIRQVFNLSGTADTLYRGVYSSSPNDVKNNYYLFSNGTCFYSGINLALADQGGKTEEMKLFVNTIYAARKATESRTVTIAPVVEITKPSTDSVIITSADLTGNDYVVAFQLKESLTNMSLDIQFGSATEPSGTWDDTVYEYFVNGTLGPAIATSGKVFLPGKTYAVLVPQNILNQTPQVLKVIATNVAGHAGTDSVSIAFSQPPVITILDPATDPSKTELYMYMDLDYSVDAPDEQYLATEPDLNIKFKVDALMNYNLTYTSNPEIPEYGILDDVDVSVISEDSTEPGVSGTYELHIPAYFIRDINVRRLTITASDRINANLKDEFTFIISRRSLFPLD